MLLYPAVIPAAQEPEAEAHTFEADLYNEVRHHSGSVLVLP